jgi:chromate transporter
VSDAGGEPTVRAHDVSFREAAAFWIKLGFINFGGPAGQISVMHQELVERRRWISEGRFLHALNYCMLLPGPEAQQLAIYIGWLLHKVRGGLLAGIAFILPAFFLIWGLSWGYAAHGDVPAVEGLFFGLQAAVVGIIAVAVIRIGSTALRGRPMVVVAAVSFVAIFVLHVSFPLIILGAGLIGATGVLGSTPPPAATDETDIALRDDAPMPSHTQPSARRAALVLIVGLVAWIVPLVVIVRAPWAPDVLSQQAAFFSKAALVTFGGAYAVLAYINQAAVGYGWLLPGQMASGLGLAESTPGPLIMVTEFVGFLGAYQHPGSLSPAVAGALGALVVTWATFAPCFLWIFLGAPYVEVLRHNARLASALSAVTAAIVGVILNLALVFGIRTLFEQVRAIDILGNLVPVPAWSSIDLFAIAIAAASFVAMWRFKVHVLWVVGVAAALGVARAILA